jgi:hypothetical protein
MFYYTAWNQENTYMLNTADKHIFCPLERCLRHLETSSTTKWCIPSASDVFLSKNEKSGGKTRWVEYIYIICLFHGIWFLSCVITCSDFYPLSNQINLCMVIIIWGIIICICFTTYYWRSLLTKWCWLELCLYDCLSSLSTICQLY